MIQSFLLFYATSTGSTISKPDVALVVPILFLHLSVLSEEAKRSGGRKAEYTWEL